MESNLLFLGSSNVRKDGGAGIVAKLLALIVFLTFNIAVAAEDAALYEVFVRPPDTPNGVEGWVGDPIPYYDGQAFQIFYLHERRPNGDAFHPWHRFTTSGFGAFEYLGESIPTASRFDQDLALGTGSIIQDSAGEYHAFYTGHNWQFPAQGLPREGIMRATSHDLDAWTKDTDFNTIVAPNSPASTIDPNEFRDPFVFKHPVDGDYTMLVSTRNRFNGNGLLLEYRSPDLDSWTLRPTPLLSVPGGPIPEVGNVFELGGVWHLTYSLPSNGAARGMYYSTSTSVGGPWSAPQRIDGRGFFAGKHVSDGVDDYLVGWAFTRAGETNPGAWQWAGNLVTHRIESSPDGTLSASAPEAVLNRFQSLGDYSTVSHFGSVLFTDDDFALSGPTSSVNFNPIVGSKKITGRVSFAAGTQDFGVTLGGADNRIVFFPSEDRIAYGSDIIVDAKLEPGVAYDLTIVIEGSIGVLYLADPNGKSVAVTTRNYEIQGETWGFFSKGGAVNFSEISLYELSIPGDYNADGRVDAADYTVWRDGGTPGNGIDGYDAWRVAYGSVSSTADSSSIPEPATALFAAAGLTFVSALRPRRS